jgi:hypothetical protein
MPLEEMDSLQPGRDQRLQAPIREAVEISAIALAHCPPEGEARTEPSSAGLQPNKAEL